MADAGASKSQRAPGFEIRPPNSSVIRVQLMILWFESAKTFQPDAGPNEDVRVGCLEAKMLRGAPLVRGVPFFVYLCGRRFSGGESRESLSQV